MPALLTLLSLLTASSAEVPRSPERLAAYLVEHQAALDAGDPAARAELDALCGQKDCSTSHLYWHTDLAQAEAAARAEHKPILSLRLLGRLDEELSCANSRFFRKMLYADPRIAFYLREHYVLHWESVRPVPKVTIDFGDGRVLTRTLTGNSIHYVLDASGRVLDGLPGLFTPEAFLDAIQADAELASRLDRLPAGEVAQAVQAWHHQQYEELGRAWAEEVQALGLSLQSMEATTDAEWRQIAARLGTPSLPAQVAAELQRHPSAWSAGQLAVTKAAVENPLLRQLRGVRANLAADSARNGLLLHRTLHGWLSNGPPPAVEPLNQQVYQSLFLSPLDDPWYGLSPEGSYPAIDDE